MLLSLPAKGKAKAKAKAKLPYLKDMVRHTTGLTLPPSRIFPISRTSNSHITSM
jgi:hypothetical protein